ncbi:MAG: FxsA family protein [Alphaproteobacteria bacterium]
MALAIFLALITMPVIEIAVFIEVGDRIGLWSTLGLIFATAIAGTALLRHQGLSTLARARATMDAGKPPVREILDGVCLVMAGLLLLTPGFVTDAIGAVLLVPILRWPLQVWAVRWMMAHGTVTMNADGSVHSSASAHWSTGGPPKKDDGVIDGEFVEIDEPTARLESPDEKKDRD